MSKQDEIKQLIEQITPLYLRLLSLAVKEEPKPEYVVTEKHIYYNFATGKQSEDKKPL
jgi:hypothetical protein